MFVSLFKNVEYPEELWIPIWLIERSITTALMGAVMINQKLSRKELRSEIETKLSRFTTPPPIDSVPPISIVAKQIVDENMNSIWKWYTDASKDGSNWSELSCPGYSIDVEMLRRCEAVSAEFRERRESAWCKAWNERRLTDEAKRELRELGIDPDEI